MGRPHRRSHSHRPYLVLHAALQARSKAALGRIVLSGHRHVVLLRPSAWPLSMRLLHDPAQVRSSASLEALLLARAPRFQALLRKSRQSIRERKGIPEKDFWQAAARRQCKKGNAAKSRVKPP